VLITATIGLIGQGEAVAAGSAACTLDGMDLTRFGALQGEVTRIGSPLGNVVSAQITCSNNLYRIETTRGDGRIDDADPSIASLGGTIEVRFADQALLDQAVNGAPTEIEFTCRAGPSASFTLTAHAV